MSKEGMDLIITVITPEPSVFSDLNLQGLLIDSLSMDHSLLECSSKEELMNP